jgi:hypothetical protein
LTQKLLRVEYNTTHKSFIRRLVNVVYWCLVWSRQLIMSHILPQSRRSGKLPLAQPYRYGRVSFKSRKSRTPTHMTTLTVSSGQAKTFESSSNTFRPGRPTYRSAGRRPLKMW